MRATRKRLFCLAAIGLVGLICVFVWILFPRHPVPSIRERVSEKAHTSAPALADRGHSVGGASPGKVRAEARRRFGVLVWPGMGARALNYSRTILSWMEEWGFQCRFVKTQATAGKDASSPLPADVTDSAWDLPDASESLNSIVLADGDLPPAEVSAVKEYLLSGGWVVMPSPEKGNALKEIDELLQLTPSRSATLMAPESPYRGNVLGAEEVRLLFPHSLAPGIAEDQWLEWSGPPGKVLYARQDQALPLLCFRRPELPALRLVGLGDGGVIHLNFPLRPGPVLEGIDLKALVGDTLAWLFARANWARPAQKEGSFKGIVREKEGQAIPGAKVTAQVYSEWGQPVQSLEVSSSQAGEFAFPAIEPAIYWVKAEAEDYYQADMYLLARVKEGDPIEILMKPKGAIFGHAYYGPGEDHPAGGIPVTLTPNRRISSALGSETVTDRDGHFSFDNLPAAQSFYLIAKAEAWLGLQEAPVALEGGRLEVDIHLESLIGVRGTTVNAVTGELLPGVEVLAEPWQHDGARLLFLDALTRKTTSREDGNFTLMLPRGCWRVTGKAVGFIAIPKQRGVYDVAVSEARWAEPSEIVVELCPEAALFGTVFTSSGEPAPRAKVTVGPGIVHWADDKGWYKTDPLRPVFVVSPHDPAFNVSAEWKNESASWFPLFYLKGPSKSYAELLRGAAPLDLHLKAPRTEPGRATIFGIVLDENGEHASLNEVELAEPSSWPDPSRFYAAPLKKTISDSEGKFQFSGISEGLYLIRARKKAVGPEGKALLLLGERWQTLVEDVPAPPVEVRLGKAYIHGKVEKADGAPMRNRYLDFSLTLHTGHKARHGFFLGENGEFTLFPSQRAVLTRPPSTATYKQWVQKRRKGLPQPLVRKKVPVAWQKGDLPKEGYVRLSVRSREGLTADLADVRWGEESLVLALPPTGRIRGRVIDADTRGPIANTGVGSSYNDRYFKGGGTDESGMFSLSNMPAGRCVLGLQVDGYWRRRMEVEVVEAEEVDVEVDIWTYWTIRGRLLLKDTGEPIVAEIHTRHGNYVSGRNGRFAISVPARRGEVVLAYDFTVPLERSGLKPVNKCVVHDPFAREIDVGDILVESEDSDNAQGGVAK